ncbi:hypothetical protein GCM10011352_27580 [Marinobacterium zhoushanense]|uniref:DUF1249 domain-containing protein n=1 Tax=Marinobacterium zhoushanense TaxID=1679163 RepID=A0ABQ1KLQ9_9GAMM|nr:DUF1249 domain-containing protein [Marinobacterium zhoushanense]GGB99832.1 hypothetical protein GCM10011352_27580 [Marinobacterium zhoushanense]
MKRKYVPDLKRQMSVCEANYARILKLLPDLDTRDQREYQVAWHGRSAVLRLQVEERFRYTSTLLVSQQLESDSRWLDAPQLLVRLYHDAGLAEVICIRQRRQLSGRYPYPNPHMHQPDEKVQLNEFLGECLSQCLSHGHMMEPVFVG